MMLNNSSDKRDFMVLIPNGRESVWSTPTLTPKVGDCIGDHKLIRASKKIDTKVGRLKHSSHYCIKGSHNRLEYITEYKPKAWQYKAWNLIGRDINWNTDAPLKSNKKLSYPFRHAIRIAVTLKLRGNVPKNGGRNNHKPIFWQLANEGDYGIYRVADTKNDMITMLEEIYDVMFNHEDDIITAIDQRGYEEAVFTMKCIVVYDDKTYDTAVGDPRNLFDLLDIEFTKKGKVKI